MSDNPSSALAQCLQDLIVEQVKKPFEQAFMTAELGTITEGLGLKLDRFKHVIDDYLVSHHLTLDTPDFTSTEDDGQHNHGSGSLTGAHSHQVITPGELQPLRPGDRVLALPVNNGQDFVIVARVVPKGG